MEFEPAKLKVKQIIQEVVKCTVCGTEGAENPNSHFQKAAVPTPPLPHSLSTPFLIAQVMYQKFMMGLPFARQEYGWAHVRRYYIESIPLDHNGKELSGSKGAEGRDLSTSCSR